MGSFMIVKSRCLGASEIQFLSRVRYNSDQIVDRAKIHKG